MSYEIKADHQKIYLLPPSIEQWVPADHEARFIREYVRTLDLVALGFNKRAPHEDGRPNYGPEMLLSVWLYGYFNRIYSSRKLERALRKELPLIWLTGENYPDHNTLWRFWKNYRATLKKLFKQTVLTADKMGLIAMILNAVDGTKMRAASSRRTMWNEKKLAEKLEKIEASIKEMEGQLLQEEKDSSPEASLPQRLQDKQKMRESILQAQAELKAEGKKTMHPNEPDAVVVKTGRVLELGYNSQAVVDAKNQIIVAEDVCTDQSDNHQLNPMIQQVKENLGKVAKETLADGGYDIEGQIRQAAENDFPVLVNEQQGHLARENPFHSSHFEFDAENKTVICPKGHKLPYKYNREKGGKPSSTEVYRCDNESCPVIAKCRQNKQRDKNGRTIYITPETLAIQAQNKKRRGEDGRELLKMRMGIVEPIFAHVKIVQEFIRFTFRGLENTQAQWGFVCSVHNLKKIYQNWKANGYKFAN